jgi:hypothetical protein
MGSCLPCKRPLFLYTARECRRSVHRLLFPEGIELAVASLDLRLCTPKVQLDYFLKLSVPAAIEILHSKKAI